MNLGESIRKGAKWLTAGSIGTQLLQFAVGVVLARLLVPADFGVIVTIQIFTGLASYLASGGTGEALVQAKHVEEHHYNVVFTMQLLICVVIYMLFFVIAPWFAVLFDNELYKNLLRVSALSFLLRPFVNLPRVRLRREMKFKAISLVDFLGMIWTSIISVTMAFKGFGPWSLVLGSLVGTLSVAPILLIIARWRPAFSYDGEAVRRLGGYGFKVSVTELVSYLSSQTSNLIVTRMLGPAMVGLYNKADSLSKLPYQTISGAVYQPVFRALAKVQDDKDQSRYIYLRTITLLTVYTLPLYIGLGWLATPFIEVVYGAKWLEVAKPLQILSMAGLIFCIGHPAGAVLAAQNWLGRELVVHIVSWALVVVGCLVGIRWGITGVAWGVVITHIYSTVHMTWLVSRCIGTKTSSIVTAILPGLLLNAILLAVLAAVDKFLSVLFPDCHQAFYLVVMSAAGGLAYLLAFLYLPIPALLAESARWRKAFRLAKA